MSRPAPLVPTLSRREALGAILAGAGLALEGRAVWAWLVPETWFQAGEEVVAFTDVPADFPTRRPGAEAPFRQDLRTLRAWITPNAEFFAVSHYGVPRVDVASWRLVTEGLVSRPLVLTLDELKRRPRVERTVTFECSGNRAQVFHGMVGNATWAGASLRALLEETRPTEGAKEVIFWAADRGKEKIRDGEYEQRFARSMSLEDALASDALLAYEMNGEPLPLVHGAPLRLVVPGWYGVANVKWVERIELGDRRLMNRFMGRDYVTLMGRQTEGGIEWVETSVTRQRVKSVVARLTRVQVGAERGLRVFGVAWTDGTPLASVEVQIDQGPWQPARLEVRDNPFAWTFFTLDTALPPPGEHTVVSRATDARGRRQPEELSLKKTYWEDNAQFRRTFLVA
jgi:DMSO/TMAO reductase YedYZ molybdopterin-dependent catalytic subunit